VTKKSVPCLPHDKKKKGKRTCLPELAEKNKELLQRSFQQRTGKPFNLDSLQPELKFLILTEFHSFDFALLNPLGQDEMGVSP
jgi:hypothetical protein